MASATMVLLSCALTFGIPLLFAVWELIAIHRRPNGPGPGPDPQPPAPPSPRWDPTTRQMPACLVPQRRPERVREPA